MSRWRFTFYDNIIKKCLGINSMIRDKNVIKLNQERSRVWRGQESCMCTSVTIKYQKVICEEIEPYVVRKYRF